MENELLHQIITALNELKDDVQSVKEDVQFVKDDVQSVKNDVQSVKDDVQSVKDVVLRIEQEHGRKLTALFDGYSANYEILERYDPRITKLERTVERLTFEIKYLKSTI